MAISRQQQKRLAEFVAPFRVEPGKNVRLPKDFDPAFKAGVDSKKAGVELLAQGVELLAEYQARLAAQDTYGLLVVLQAMDAAGKDGTIRHVMSGVNPQGVSVHSFKVPSVEELDHDYLWRYAKALPTRGGITIFNRSHYEEVVVVRVHEELLERQRLPRASRGKGVWKRRYHEINEWEHFLVDNGFRIVKLFLNVSKEEQRRRFLRRIDDRDRNWKFSAADVRERGYWDDYQRAFSQMLSNTSTPWAPWHVIPADRKWFMRIAVASVIVRALMDIDPKFPTVSDEERQALLAAKVGLLAEGGEQPEPDPEPESEPEPEPEQAPPADA